MSTQIEIRLPAAVVEFIDAEVAAGRARSRSAFILRALEREHHRCMAKRQQPAAEEAESQSYAGYRSLLWSASSTAPGIDPSL
jgi:Arc/MetJ-type ribon-helix-helix transcriptional regulator